MAKPLRVAFCVSGGGRLAAEAIEARRELDLEPALVVSGPRADRCVDDLARAQGFPSVRLPAEDRAAGDALVARALADAAPDLVCLTFDRIIPPDVLAAFTGTMINVHMSLLPAFKGRRGLEQAVAAGTRFAGATVHEVTTELDGGPIVAQCVLPLLPSDSAQTFGDRLFPHLRAMVLQTLAWYAHDRVVRDVEGRIWVRAARYGEYPVSPSPEIPSLIVEDSLP